ncbi:hypothetical protein BLX88_25920 [Bacillus obstructivus]|uniref:hypothetical protein n=1 Tax=Heyndrickxia sp. FSL W8-0496 TaxID=2954702 RepID=UPI0009034438|nr:hypothetical protein BLX88_25920 [Bacillus obstructivus]
MKNISLNEVNIKTAVRLMMENTEYSQFQEVANALDIKKSTFQSALDNDALRVRDFLKVINLLGYEMKLEKKL